MRRRREPEPAAPAIVGLQVTLDEFDLILAVLGSNIGHPEIETADGADALYAKLSAIRQTLR